MAFSGARSTPRSPGVWLELRICPLCHVPGHVQKLLLLLRRTRAGDFQRRPSRDMFLQRLDPNLNLICRKHPSDCSNSESCSTPRSSFQPKEPCLGYKLAIQKVCYYVTRNVYGKQEQCFVSCCSGAKVLAVKPASIQSCQRKACRS